MKKVSVSECVGVGVWGEKENSTEPKAREERKD